MNILIYEIEPIRRLPLVENLHSSNKFKNVFTSFDEESFKNLIATEDIDIVLSRFTTFFDSGLPLYLKKIGKDIRILTYVSTDYDTEDRAFHQLAKNYFLLNYNPELEDVVTTLCNVYNAKDKRILNF